MSGGFLVASLLAGACAFVIGSAVVARRDSILRSPTGGIILAICGIVALLLPPMVASFGSTQVSGLAHALWIVLLLAGLAVGARVWRLRSGVSLFAIDDVPVGRAASQLMVVGSLDDALEILQREKVTARDLPNLAEPLRHVGSYYFLQLPPTNAAFYDLVAQYVPQPLSTEVADRILEGAARK